jgi:Meiotically up-regulated gene 113
VIYFMQPTDGGPVKIGYSIDVDRRQSELEETYGRPLVVLATMEGGRVEEGKIHRRFRRHRIGQSEQFRPDAELMEFIGRPPLVGINPDACDAMDSEIKAVRLELSPEAHKELRIEAAKHDMSMAAFVRGLVEDFLAKRKAAK